MKKTISVVSLCIFIFLISDTIVAQIDNQSWTSFSLRKKISKNTHIQIKPTDRRFNNLKDHQNSSIDLSFQTKMKNGWSFGGLARTWFIPNEKVRQFLWANITHSYSSDLIKVKNKFRVHYALDINDRKDADFLRWNFQVGPNLKKRIDPFIAIVSFFRLNGFNEVQRIRYEPGLKWSINDAWILNAVFRREVILSFDPNIKINVYVVTLGYLMK